jgi:hypothetical protein
MTPYQIAQKQLKEVREQLEIVQAAADGYASQARDLHDQVDIQKTMIEARDEQIKRLQALTPIVVDDERMKNSEKVIFELRKELFAQKERTAEWFRACTDLAERAVKKLWARTNISGTFKSPVEAATAALDAAADRITKLYDEVAEQRKRADCNYQTRRDVENTLHQSRVEVTNLLTEVEARDKTIAKLEADLKATQECQKNQYNSLQRVFFAAQKHLGVTTGDIVDQSVRAMENAAADIQNLRRINKQRSEANKWQADRIKGLEAQAETKNIALLAANLRSRDTLSSFFSSVLQNTAVQFCTTPKSAIQEVRAKNVELSEALANSQERFATQSKRLGTLFDAGSRLFKSYANRPINVDPVEGLVEAMTHSAKRVEEVSARWDAALKEKDRALFRLAETQAVISEVLGLDRTWTNRDLFRDVLVGAINKEIDRAKAAAIDELTKALKDAQGELVRQKNTSVYTQAAMDKVRARRDRWSKIAFGFRDAADYLWTVVANVSGGDWSKQSKDWQEAAAKARDGFFAVCSKHSVSPCGQAGAEPVAGAVEAAQEIKYPVYAKAVYNKNQSQYNLVVKFTGRCTGTVVESDVPQISVGEECTYWVQVDKAEHWRILPSYQKPGTYVGETGNILIVDECGSCQVTKPEIKYPLLAYYIGEGSGPFIVRFTAERTGTAVWSQNKNRYVGEAANDWANVTDKRFWDTNPFPLVAKFIRHSPKGEFKVFFTAPTAGVVIETDKSWKVGHTEAHFSLLANPEDWEIIDACPEVWSYKSGLGDYDTYFPKGADDGFVVRSAHEYRRVGDAIPRSLLTADGWTNITK